MKTISRYIMTLALLLTAVTGAWADEPKVYTTAVDVTSLKVGDILAEGFSLTSTNPNGAIFNIADQRGKRDETIHPGGYGGLYTKNITAYGANATFTTADGTYYPIDENSNVGNAWVVTQECNQLMDMDLIIAGVTIELPLTVTWDATTKTGTFAMPASDVVLTPIYAKAAAFATTGTEPDVKTLLPEAAEGVIAGTDASLIAEGTGIVAFAGTSTEVTQGTLMYAIGTSATEAPALTAFSATVPTAENYDDAATVYVWYYIQGQDTPDGQEATEENTFNDTEICTTPLTVQVLTNKFDLTFKAANANTIDATQASKGTVSVKEGTGAAADKTSSIANGKITGIKMGSEVKLTANPGYKFRKVEVKKTTDFTDRVSTTAWTGMDAMSPAFSTPEVTTSDGRKTRFAEVFRTDVSATGVIMQQTVNVANGTYIVELYANSCAAQYVTTDMADGATDVAYVFANDVKKFITSKIASQFSESGVYTLEVTVTDGQLTLGIGKEKAGTNWHTIQIKSLNQKASSGNE